MSKFYITTPIYYVNGAPHIGHAYTSIAADVMARWHRLRGDDVFFLTGTDEHGQKVEKAARDAGLEPQAFVDQVSQKFRDMSAKMGLTNDDFIRTTEKRHRVACQALWQALQEAGHIYLGHYEGWYAVRDEAFYDQDELRVLVDGSRIGPTGAPVEWVREPSYFFRLSAFQDRLLHLYTDNPEFIQPASRRSEVMSFVRSGLRDLSVSRTSFAWGVPVPGDEAHVMYVWLDALANYLSAVGYPDDTAPHWRYWPPDIQVVGKDIIRFHCVYWPAFLMGAGLDLPQSVCSNGWWTASGEKMSKSLGNAVDADALVDRFGLDAVRYFLLREVPFGNDGDYNDAALVRRLNIELANDLGNLCQRTLPQIAKNCAGLMPARGPITAEDEELLRAARVLPEAMQAKLDRLAFSDALEETWRVIRSANAYIAHQAPWTLRKTDLARMGTVLAVVADVIRRVALVLQPFMPGSMGRMLDQLGVDVQCRNFSALDIEIAAGTQLPMPEGVFPKYVEPA